VKDNASCKKAQIKDTIDDLPCQLYDMDRVGTMDRLKDVRIYSIHQVNNAYLPALTDWLLRDTVFSTDVKICSSPPGLIPSLSSVISFGDVIAGLFWVTSKYD